VVPVFNKLPLTLRFLDSFRNVRYPRHSVVLVDDGSTDGTADAVAARFPEVVLLRGDGNLWWSGGTNLGVRHALDNGYDYVLTINNDTVVHPDFLSRLVATAEANPRSLVGACIKFLDEPEKIWAAGGHMNFASGVILQLRLNGATRAALGPAHPDTFPVDILTGCGALVPAACFREIGLYDERWCPQYHGDSEYTLRAWKHGYRVLVDLRAVVWNEVRNTCVYKNVFSRRSPWFWRPLTALHLRYCPLRHIPRSMGYYFGRIFSTGVYRALRGARAEMSPRRPDLEAAGPRRPAAA
jgi:GT2 family glycosyltransferase